MKVDVLEALFASAVLYGVGSYLFWVNKTIITWTADAVFGPFQRQGADVVLRIWNKEEEELSNRHPCRSLTTWGKKCD